MKKQVLAIAAAVAIMFGATVASATGGYGSGYNKNYNDNYNYNKNYNDNYNKNNNYNDNYNKNYNKNYNDNYNKNTNNNNSINNNNSTAKAKAKSNANANANSTSNANSTATGGDATATATGGSATSSAAGGAGGDGGNGGGGGNSNVNIEGDDVAASSAAPIALTTSNDTCMGSTGLGVQGMQFGFSVGSTWTDSNCIMLKNSRELKMQGHNKAAKARLCMDDDNAMAFELAGEPCPRALKSTQNAIATLGEWKADYAATTAAQTAALPGTTKAKATKAAIEVDVDFGNDE